MTSQRRIHFDGHRAPLSYHGGLLHDVNRMDAYERAIRARVRPGDVVLDLGCGTGILAMLAARRGARVHAVESMAVADLARTLVAANGLADRITVHRADMVTLPPIEPVDLVVSDFLGAFLVDDLMLPAVEAAGRWLKPGGGFLPSAVRLRVAPASVGLRELDVWQTPFYGLDLSAAYPRALAQCHRVDLEPASLMAPAATFHDYTPPAPLGRCGRTLRFSVEREGVMGALIGWFEATMAPGIVLTTAPGVDTHWGQYVFPIAPLPVHADDVLEVRLSLEEPAGDLAWRWTGRLLRDGATIASFDHQDETDWLAGADD